LISFYSISELTQENQIIIQRSPKSLELTPGILVDLEVWDDFIDNDPNKEIQISFQQEKDIKEAFSIFDIQGKGYLSKEDFIEVLKSLEKNFSLEEIDTLMKEVDKGKKGKIYYPEFRSLMIRQLQPGNKEEEIINFFKIFDPEQTGLISVEEFRLVLTEMGDTLTMEEVEEIILNAKPDEEKKIHIDQLIRLFCT